MKEKKQNVKNAEKTVNPAEDFGRSVREFMESIAIALVLAFLFRTFLAEMFVIPTGSMAPTLFGQHKDVVCPECGAPFQVGVQEGVNIDCALCPNCNMIMNFRTEEQLGHSHPNFSGDRILVGKYPYYFSSPKRWDVVVFLFPGGANMNYIKRCVGLPGETVKIHGGDIYIKPSKKDWERQVAQQEKLLRTHQSKEAHKKQEDVVPQTHQENNEDSSRPFQIARKPPEKILATMIPVYENNYQSDRLRRMSGLGFKPRWHQDNIGLIGKDVQAYTLWQVQDDGKSFYCKSAPGEMTGWLVYQNLVMTQDNWKLASMKVEEFQKYVQDLEQWHETAPEKYSLEKKKFELKPRLITDMTAYNTQISLIDSMDLTSYNSLDEVSRIPGEKVPAVKDSHYGIHWVKDLIVECQVDVRSLQKGEFTVGMNRGSKAFWCKVNLATGEVALEIPARPDFGSDILKQQEYDSKNQNKENAYVARAHSNMNGIDKYHFRMANVDDQVHVWIDNEVLKFDLPTSYFSDRDLNIPTEDDMLHPVQIGCRDCEVKLSDLGLFRDIYYVARGRDNNDSMSDFVRKSPYGYQEVHTNDFDFYSDPSRWEVFSNLRSVEFELNEDDGVRKYFMLGDNSSNSADSRCWTYPRHDPRCSSYVTEHYVPESLLVGEAYYVYWPHTWYPFVPNFEKIRQIK